MLSHLFKNDGANLAADVDNFFGVAIRIPNFIRVERVSHEHYQVSELALTAGAAIV